MAFRYFSNNPLGKSVGDCVIRALSAVLNTDWDDVYINLCSIGLQEGDMPNSNAVFGKYLMSLGYRRRAIPDTCPDCYTVEDFCRDNPKGKFLLALDGHVVAVVDGDYYDTWDSGKSFPIYYWRKEEKNGSN